MHLRATKTIIWCVWGRFCVYMSEASDKFNLKLTGVDCWNNAREECAEIQKIIRAGPSRCMKIETAKPDLKTGLHQLGFNRIVAGNVNET